MEGEKKKLDEALATSKAAHEEDLANLKLMASFLKSEQERSKQLAADDDKLSKGISIYLAKLEKDTKRADEAQSALEQAQAEVVSLLAQVELLSTRSDETVIEAFKVSPFSRNCNWSFLAQYLRWASFIFVMWLLLRVSSSST